MSRKPDRVPNSPVDSAALGGAADAKRAVGLAQDGDEQQANRFGREAKIGVAIIVVLMLGLCGAIAVRWVRGGGQSNAPLAAAVTPGEASAGDQAVSTLHAASREPTTLTPTRSGEQPPAVVSMPDSASSTGVSRANAVLASAESAGGQSTASDSSPAAAPPSLPPSLMPAPPQPQTVATTAAYGANYEPASNSAIPASSIPAQSGSGDPFHANAPWSHTAAAHDPASTASSAEQAAKSGGSSGGESARFGNAAASSSSVGSPAYGSGPYGSSAGSAAGNAAGSGTSGNPYAGYSAAADPNVSSAATPYGASSVQTVSPGPSAWNSPGASAAADGSASSGLPSVPAAYGLPPSPPTPNEARSDATASSLGLSRSRSRLLSQASPPRDENDRYSTSGGSVSGLSSNGLNGRGLSTNSLSSRGAAASGRASHLLGAEDARGDRYVVQPNDNYWTISQQVYTTGAYFRALAEYNRRRIPREDELQVGDIVMTPTVEELEQRYASLCPKASRRPSAQATARTVSARGMYASGRTYVTQHGDTLSDIARMELGKASRWNEIYEINRDAIGPDRDFLPPGITLVLPASENDANARSPRDASDTMTRRPDALPYR